MSKGSSRKAERESRQKQIRRNAEANLQAVIFDNDPLKQYVRRFGWLELINQYCINMQRLGVIRPLKILTLPGRNASDIGLLFREGIIFANEKQVLNVAICDKENASSVQANLAGLGSFLAASNKELSYTLENDTRFTNQFPFDVINLDFCNQLFDYNSVRNLRALRRIFWLQKGQAFLLLLTNRSNPELNIQEAELILSDNMSLESFRQSYIERYGSDQVSLCMRDNVSLTQLLFPKVIARLARDNGYRISERFVAHYSRNNGKYYMVCHSFELIPIDRNKESLWYSPNNNRPRRHEFDELVYELPISIRRLSEREYENFVASVLLRDSSDLGREIDENPELRGVLEEEAKLLDHWWDVGHPG